MVKLQRARK
jgi:hypothetical protein